MPQPAVLILAAGLSTRMKSKKSKVLHDIAGRPIVSYSIDAAKACRASQIFVVRGPGQEDLKEYLASRGIKDVVQAKPLGTANAVQSASKVLKGFSGKVLILCGDVPLLRPESLKSFVKSIETENAMMGVLTMTLTNPAGYGRIVRNPDGEMIRIVEDRDATDDEKKICEVNSGIICADSKWFFETLKNIKSDNAKSEFYLTDLVPLGLKENLKVLGFRASPPEDFLGINTRVELAKAGGLMQERINKKHMLDGVGILDPYNTHIDADVCIGNDTLIMPYSFLLGKTKIGKDCVIENGVVLRDAIVGDGVHIKSYSIVDESSISAEAVVGPFARIRPQSKVGKGARVGNFVELKKCDLKEGAKANHLTYLGDASIGPRANIGCGTITCNYDGKAKYKTIVGEGAFVGSDTQFVAPVRIGRGSIIGAGSTITKDVPADALALSRTNQTVIRGWAKKRKK